MKWLELTRMAVKLYFGESTLAGAGPGFRYLEAKVCSSLSSNNSLEAGAGGAPPLNWAHPYPNTVLGRRNSHLS
ncbi:hypothetical protein EVAR_46812_1 [Eumeta japonica]|uniref:Uncharacterized protein n=1 Tax=Eumeta variegata TaxID=151549 RepID=A0A4C1XFT5_EUMVA|nr:hypothetical protein EVAR_46812_1 [Eumeta japonica]